MGEVYQATDTNLGRQVAIKVIPELMAADAERLARFDREAKTLAVLNHPNIAAIYGLERSDGQTALVMEFVDGPTLADRIAHGPVPVDEALAFATQIADALETAHDQGIIHRDLKPANIKVRVDGAVKVLDFGLAKAMEPVGGIAANVSWSPTITLPAMTQIGVILGTAAYMSPEQAKGRAADRRSDIWSFGVVLFEMLTGRSLFERPSIPETLAAVIRDEPDWAALPSSTPARVRELLRRSVTKDPRSRLQAIGEARIALELAMNPLDPAAVPSAISRPSVLRRLLPWVSAAIAAGLVVAAAVWAPWRPQTAPLSAQLTARLDEVASIALANAGASTAPAIAVSPDGQAIAFRGRTDSDPTIRIYLRRLDQLNAAPLVGTEDGAGIFFSPDNRWIAFSAGRTLKKVPVAGGTPVVLSEVGGTRGGDWTKDGRIVYSSARTGLSIVSADGGQPEALTTLDRTAGEITHRFPVVLPDDRAVLYTSNTNSVSYDDASIMAVPLTGGPPKLVFRGGYAARYVSSGHLMYINRSTLFAVPFDLDGLAVTGKPAPVVAGVRNDVGSGVAHYSVSPAGTLVYLPETAASGGVPIVWLDAQGKVEPIRDAGRYLNMRLSPDGRQMAMEVFDRGRSNIWILDLLRGVMSRLTGENAYEQFPLWTPDGRRVVFSSNRDSANAPHLYWKRVDGAGAIEQLTTEKRSEVEQAGSWLPDGRTLAFQAQDSTNADILTVHVQGDEQTGWKPQAPRAVLNAPYSELSPAFSPDGRWLAYVSNESGTSEVYVRRYPELDGKEQISSGGASLPTWSRSARELFYRSGRTIMAITYAPNGEMFGASRPRVWAQVPMDNDLGRTFDLHPDGRRIAVMKMPDTAPDAQRRDTAVLVFDFASVLRSRVH